VNEVTPRATRKEGPAADAGELYSHACFLRCVRARSRFPALRCSACNIKRKPRAVSCGSIGYTAGRPLAPIRARSGRPMERRLAVGRTDGMLGSWFEYHRTHLFVMTFPRRELIGPPSGTMQWKAPTSLHFCRPNSSVAIVKTSTVTLPISTSLCRVRKLRSNGVNGKQSATVGKSFDSSALLRKERCRAAWSRRRWG